MPDQPTIDRIPLAHSVRYVARGLPEVPNQYGPGTLAPSEITLTYRAASDSQLGRVHAYVAGRLRVDGAEIPLLPGGLYGQHYDDGLEGWPEWLAEEARLHDPDAAVVAPTADRAALRDRIAEALADADGWKWAPGFKAMSPTWHGYQARADAVLAVLPAPADRAALIRAHCPDHLDDNSAEGSWMNCHCDVADDMERRAVAEATPVAASPERANESVPSVAADRAAVLTEAADALERKFEGASRATIELRRMAGEAPATEEQSRG